MNINNPKLLWQLNFEGAWPTAIAFLGSSRKLAAANQEGQIYVWDLPEAPPAFEAEKNSERKAPDHAPARRLEGHANGVARLVATTDGQTLVSASLDHTLRLWQPHDAATGTAEAVLDSEQRKSKAKRERKDEHLTAPGVAVETIGPAHTLTGHDDWVLSLGISADGRRLISGDAAARVIVWDLAERNQIVRWSGYPWNWIQALALSPDGQTAVVSEHRYKRDDFDIPAAALRVYDAATGEMKLDILKTMFPKYDPQQNTYGSGQIWRKFIAQGLVAADISPDGKLVALGQGGETDTGKVQLVEIETGKLVREIGGHQQGATDVKFSADGKYVLSTGRDTTLRICQVEDGKEVAALGTPRGGQFKDWLSALAVSPDQTTVAATDIAGQIHVWSLNDH
jgi:WD40 repeat protein